MPKLTVSERAAVIAENALAHGWDEPTWDNFLAKLMLVVTEVQEADEVALGDAALFMPEVADIVIRTLAILHSLDCSFSDFGGRDVPSNVLSTALKRLRESAEFYRRGMDVEALLKLWEMISEIDAWCTAEGLDLWDAVDKKMAFNLTRPHRNGKKRSIG